jgi:hypothetical protein
VNCNLTPTTKEDVEHWNCLGERGWGKEPNYQCQTLSEWKAKKVESGGEATSQPPRGAVSTKQRSGEVQRMRVGMGWQANLPKWGRWWVPELVLWDRGQHSKLNCSTFLGERLTKQSCSCGTTQLQPGENNSSSHPEWTGRLISSPNYNLPVYRRNQILLTS